MSDDHLDRLEKAYKSRGTRWGCFYDSLAALCAELRQARSDLTAYREFFKHDVADEPGLKQAWYELGATRAREELLGLVGTMIDQWRAPASEDGDRRDWDGANEREGGLQALREVRYQLLDKVLPPRPPLPAEQATDLLRELVEGLAVFKDTAGRAHLTLRVRRGTDDLVTRLCALLGVPRGNSARHKRYVRPVVLQYTEQSDSLDGPWEPAPGDAVYPAVMVGAAGKVEDVGG